MNGARHSSFFPFVEETKQIEKKRQENWWEWNEINWWSSWSELTFGGLRAQRCATATSQKRRRASCWNQLMEWNVFSSLCSSFVIEELNEQMKRANEASGAKQTSSAVNVVEWQASWLVQQSTWRQWNEMKQAPHQAANAARQAKGNTNQTSPREACLMVCCGESGPAGMNLGWVRGGWPTAGQPAQMKDERATTTAPQLFLLPVKLFSSLPSLAAKEASQRKESEDNLIYFFCWLWAEPLYRTTTHSTTNSLCCFIRLACFGVGYEEERVFDWLLIKERS